MRRTLKIVSIIIAAIAIIYGCDGGGSSELTPQITDIQPESGPPGTTVTISGNDFSPTPSENSVMFDSTSATVNSATETELETEVPEGIDTGPAEVEVSVDGNTAEGPSFIVEREAPGITSIQPDSGYFGTEVTIQGLNFSEVPAENSITFAGISAPVNSASENQLVTEVPQEATDGPVEVSVNGKTATGPNFDVISPVSNKIVYVNWTDSGHKLRSVNPDGTEDELLIDDDIGTFSISPNGLKVAYYKGPINSADLYVSNIDGSNEIRLTTSSDGNIDPSWSPDGDQIVFSREDDEDEKELFVVNPDGSNLRQLTDSGISAREPVWSPDGSKIAFDAFPADNYEIFIVNADGTNVTQLTSDPGNDQHPAWSPDSRSIAFDSDRNGFTHIFTMNPDGSGIQQIIDNEQHDNNPTWSPGGSEILFEGFDGKSINLYKINADGSGRINSVLTKASDERDPKWIEVE